MLLNYRVVNICITKDTYPQFLSDLYVNIYIYIYIYMCVCVCVCVYTQCDLKMLALSWEYLYDIISVSIYSPFQSCYLQKFLWKYFYGNIFIRRAKIDITEDTRGRFQQCIDRNGEQVKTLKPKNRKRTRIEILRFLKHTHTHTHTHTLYIYIYIYIYKST